MPADSYPNKSVRNMLTFGLISNCYISGAKETSNNETLTQYCSCNLFDDCGNSISGSLVVNTRE